MAESAQEHLLNHLRDAHAIELQALRQLSRAAQRSDDESRAIYNEHLEQTREHEQTIKELVEAQDRPASPVVDKTLRGGAAGLRQVADVTTDTPITLAMHMFALEHLEIATYELLCEIAKAADHERAAEAAEQILEQEREAAEKVAGTFDRATDSLMESDRSGNGEDAEEEGSSEDPKNRLLLKHLREVHALEQQSMQLLQTATDEVGADEELERIFHDHLEQTHEHERLVNDRIEAHGVKPSAVRDLHMSTAKTGLHDLAAGPPDAYVKLAMNLFCVEHLEVVGYEFLIRIANHCGDSETVEVAEKILEQEREAAQAVRDAFGRSVELMLESDAQYEVARSAESPEEEDPDPSEG